jgi:uncharacterized membrane protein YeaQ/YmgE (transglycosylase-associated protein family)
MGGLLYWIIVGLLAGWLAGQFTRGTGFGLVGNLIVGILGAILGGFLAGLIGFGSTNIIGSVIIAFIGAVVLVWLVNTLAGRRAV